MAEHVEPVHIGIDFGRSDDITSFHRVERTVDGIRLLVQGSRVAVGEMMKAMEAVWRMAGRQSRWLLASQRVITRIERIERLGHPPQRRRRGIRGRKRIVTHLMGAMRLWRNQ